MKRSEGLPGKTTTIRAERVLVVAPHYDDEILGCGGLLIQQLRAGGRADVLFVSDGSGGEEQVDDREAYAARRREEAGRVADRLGVASVRELGLKDGSLADHVPEIADGIGRALDELRPDLLLAPSPWEITADHRASFQGLHRTLWPLREGEERHGVASGMSVLLYEVNRPLDPDVLVDVSEQLEEMKALMRLYESQLEMHGYLEAMTGLRRYRTLSLPPEVDAAEAYRSLRLEDFTTRSEQTLLEDMGIASPPAPRVTAGPLVSVIVRTKDRPAVLHQALGSIARGHYRRVEVVVVNDGGAPPELPVDFPFPIRRRDLDKSAGPAAAAQVGLEAARGEFVGFLDDDDLFYPEHLSRLVAGARDTGCAVVYSDAAVVDHEREPGGWRTLQRRLPYSRDFEPSLLLLDNFIPFNTVLMSRDLATDIGPFDTSLPYFEDWDFLLRLSARTSFEHLRGVTCEYRHYPEGNDQLFGRDPSTRQDLRAGRERMYAKHAERLGPDELARAASLWSADLAKRTETCRILRKELYRFIGKVQP